MPLSLISEVYHASGRLEKSACPNFRREAVFRAYMQTAYGSDAIGRRR